MPLRTGAGVKSKVVEALREGLPIVTTTVGAQGLPEIESIIAIATGRRAWWRRQLGCWSTMIFGPKRHGDKSVMPALSFPETRSTEP